MLPSSSSFHSGSAPAAPSAVSFPRRRSGRIMGNQESKNRIVLACAEGTAAGGNEGGVGNLRQVEWCCRLRSAQALREADVPAQLTAGCLEASAAHWYASAKGPVGAIVCY
jgi:hypothetical protein